VFNTPDEIGAVDIRTRGAKNGVASLNASSKVVEEPASKGLANGVASLNASSKVVEDPANATATPTAGKIPIADGSGKLDGWVTVALTKYFESTEQTLTAGGALTLAHGFGIKPKLWFSVLICKSSEQGYTTGDEVGISSTWESTLAADSLGISIAPDTTNLNVRYGSDVNILLLLNKSTGTATTITLNNWRLVVRAWA
jgi:hypothetical protein